MRQLQSQVSPSAVQSTTVATHRCVSLLGRFVFHPGCLSPSTVPQGYHVDVASFLRRSGLAEMQPALLRAAEAEVHEHREARRRAAARRRAEPAPRNATDSANAVAEGEHALLDLERETGMALPAVGLGAAALHRIETAARNAQRLHPHGDALFGEDSAPLAARLAVEAEVPSHGAVVRLSDALQTITLHPDDGFGRVSTLQGWASAWSPRHYDVHAEMVQSFPLHGAAGDASHPRVLNADRFRDRIVIFSRGSIPLAYKVRVAASHGALAAIIIDLGDRCADEEFGQACVRGAAKQAGEGWGATDPKRIWQGAEIPAIIVGRDAGQKLLELSSR